MFQFPGLPPLRVHGLQPWGFPHSDICGSKVICTSPQLFAAYRVLRRLWEPRHPPYALICFQFFINNDKSLLTWVSSNLLLWFFCRKYFRTSLPFCSCNFHHNTITYLYMTISQLPLLIYYFQHVNELFRNLNDQLDYHNPFCYSGLPVSGLSVSFVNITGFEPDYSAFGKALPKWVISIYESKLNWVSYLFYV